MAKITDSRHREIGKAVSKYEGMRTDFDHLGDTLNRLLVRDERLKKYIHSSKYRTKIPKNLREKIERKTIERLKLVKIERPPLITAKNLLEQVEDLVGIRLLHLHTQQMSNIHPAIIEILNGNNYQIIDDPVVYIWDTENRDFFKSIGIEPKERKDKEMYTSVHYVVSSSQRPDIRMEIQVRTLMEEVWGEVSHTVNYPKKTEILACREQLKALARFTSGCSRLVDSIFATKSEAEDKNNT